MPGQLGRLPRTFRPMLPFSAMLGRGDLPSIPDRTGYMDNVRWHGPMYNDRIGDCTAAAKGHILEVHTKVARNWQITDPDKKILQLYMEATGYRPDDPNNPQSNNTDQGANMQDLANYIVQVGVPIDMVNGRDRHKYLGVTEVDHRNMDHIARCVYVFGHCDIGFEVPDYIMQQGGLTWDYQPGQRYQIDGGHDIAIFDYELDKANLTAGRYAVKAFHLCSWGESYTMTAAFFRQFVDEAYGYVSPSWLDTTGHTPAHMSKQQLLDVLKQSW
jgi:hypothetical protein